MTMDDHLDIAQELKKIGIDVDIGIVRQLESLNKNIEQQNILMRELITAVYQLKFR